MTIKELKDAINAKRAEAQDMLAADNLEGAKAAKAELDTMTDKLSVMEAIEREEEEAMMNVAPVAPEKDPVHEFANAARMGFRNDRTVSTNNEGTGADGGYTVPQDILTQINKYKEAEFRLETLVDVEKVNTMSGRRTYQTKAQHTGFNKVSEGAAIGAKSGPQFSVLTYQVEKYAGYLPVTNELLADSDANITAVLTEWLAKEDVATHNHGIIETVTTDSPTSISDLNDIKKIINVDLGQAYAGGVKIITNDDGFNWLDTMVVKTSIKTTAGSTVTTGEYVSNEYLLKPMQDQTGLAKMSLAVGARMIPIVVIPNTVLPSGVDTTDTTSDVIPFVIGDLKEGVKLFDRQQLSITTSTQATVGTGENVINAFEMDMTLFRGITRFDVKIKDADAFKCGAVVVPQVG